MDTGTGTSYTRACQKVRRNRGGIVAGGGWGGTALEEILNVGDRVMDAANNRGMYVPMQQSCMLFTCTPKPKM